MSTIEIPAEDSDAGFRALGSSKLSVIRNAQPNRVPGRPVFRVIRGGRREIRVKPITLELPSGTLHTCVITAPREAFTDLA